MVYNHSFFHTDRISRIVVRTAQVIAINALWQIIASNPSVGEQTKFIKQRDLLILDVYKRQVSASAIGPTSDTTCWRNGSLSSFSGSATCPLTIPLSSRASRMAIGSIDVYKRQGYPAPPDGRFCFSVLLHKGMAFQLSLIHIFQNHMNALATEAASAWYLTLKNLLATFATHPWRCLLYTSRCV